MVQFLPRPKSFGSQLAEGIGQGVAGGVNFASQLALDKFKNKQRQDLLSQVEGGGGALTQQETQQSATPQQDMGQMFQEVLPIIEQQLGRELTSQDLEKIWGKMNEFGGGQGQGTSGQKQPQGMQQGGQGSAQPSAPKQSPSAQARIQQKQYAALGEHELARAKGDEAKSLEKREAEERNIYGEEAKEFWKEIGESRKKIPDLETSLEAQTDAVMKGDVDPWSRGHIADVARSLGAPSALVAPLETPGSKEFKTGLKTYLSTTLRDAFRGSTTGREIDLAEGLLAQAGVSREGNLASLWLLQSQLMLQKEKVRLATDLKRQGYSGYEIPDMIDEQLQPYRKELSSQYFQAIDTLRQKE